jgi:hypothetical protein
MQSELRQRIDEMLVAERRARIEEIPIQVMVWEDDDMTLGPEIARRLLELDAQRRTRTAGLADQAAL